MRELFRNFSQKLRELSRSFYYSDMARDLESPISDFEIEGKTFEVGGKKKGKKQITEAEEGYIVKDDTEYVFDNQVPLWMFGFLY